MYTDHQGPDDQCGPRISAHQCHMPVPISAYQCTSMPHISAHLSCLSMSPINANHVAYQCASVPPISAITVPYISAAFQRPSVMPVNAHQCNLPVPPHQCTYQCSLSVPITVASLAHIS
ncbi:unnamed protein product, partial [Staurois parvus]